MSSLNKKHKEGIKPINILEICQKELPELDFVFNGLKTGTIGFISSAGGVGKSMFALHLAFSLADKTKTYNFQPIINSFYQRGIICYMNLEDPEEILQHRIKKISNKIKNDYKNGLQILEEINNHLMIYPLYGTNFTLLDKNGELNKDVYDNILKIAKYSRLIIIDTFRRLHYEDENNNAKMSEILKILEEICNKTNTSILLLHHQNKTSILEKQNGQTAMRGASALVDNARLLINMSVVSEKEAKKLKIAENMRKNYIKVTFAKVNYSKIPDDFYLVKSLDGTLDLCNCFNNGDSIDDF